MLVPVSASDQEEMFRLPDRRIITITANPKFPEPARRWYFAMLQVVMEATGRWPSVDVGHRELMLRAGMFDSLVIDTNGTARYTPQSTSTWGNAEWRSYLDAVIPIVIADYSTEAKREFRTKVDRHLGISYKEIMG